MISNLLKSRSKWNTLCFLLEAINLHLGGWQNLNYTWKELPVLFRYDTRVQTKCIPTLASSEVSKALACHPQKETWGWLSGRASCLRGAEGVLGEGKCTNFLPFLSTFLSCIDALPFHWHFIFTACLILRLTLYFYPPKYTEGYYTFLKKINKKY